MLKKHGSVIYGEYHERTAMTVTQLIAANLAALCLLFLVYNHITFAKMRDCYVMWFTRAYWTDYTQPSVISEGLLETSPSYGRTAGGLLISSPRTKNGSQGRIYAFMKSHGQGPQYIQFLVNSLPRNPVGLSPWAGI